MGGAKGGLRQRNESDLTLVGLTDEISPSLLTPIENSNPPEQEDPTGTRGQKHDRSDRNVLFFESAQAGNRCSKKADCSTKNCQFLISRHECKSFKLIIV